MVESGEIIQFMSPWDMDEASWETGTKTDLEWENTEMNMCMTVREREREIITEHALVIDSVHRKHAMFPSKMLWIRGYMCACILVWV